MNIWEAAKKGNIVAIQESIRSGTNVDALDNMNQSTLYYAVQQGHINTVKELISLGA